MTTQSIFTNEVELLNIVLDTLGNEEAETFELQELHYKAFNEDEYFIYYSTAKEQLNKYDVFDAIQEVKEYEEENFGQVFTDLSEPCKVANMLMYIKGEEIVNTLVYSFNKDIEEVTLEEAISRTRYMIQQAKGN